MKNVVLVVLTLASFACARHETMASKSAAAYREAQAKGTAVGGGHDHGGHETATATAGTAEIDHSAHDSGADPHAGHAMTVATADHGAHGAMPAAAADHAQHAGMQHGGMQHGSVDHTAHAVAAGAAAHDQHAGMEHGATPSPAAHAHHQQQPAASSAHAEHGSMLPAAGAPNIALGAPTSNAEMQRTRPAGTLQPDAFDAPAPIAVEEANKAAGGGARHHGHGTPKKEQ